MANRLINEQSPYLLQHAHNPVDWYPWGDEPFERARTENKPVIVSIGYAACHWCHVMERESFENEQVAAYMNEHFINIKVDREEHPNVDHFYMDAVQAITGSGGWPLNAFVTPDRIPFYGGTYYPPRAAYNRPSWIELLQRMNQIWNEQPDEVDQQAGQMLEYLKQAAEIGSSANQQKADMAFCSEMAANLLKNADKTAGGFGRAPKFPGTMSIAFLLEHYYFTKNKEALDHALFSLDCMIKGGIYDQLGGGFARYSTDQNWLAPHFEKMLYDNALLVDVLCDAYKLTGKEEYRKIIEQTIDFIEREMTDPSGIFYSAIDADSEGHEGLFYTWTWDQWNSIITDDIVTAHFGVLEEGNWEGTNILHVSKTVEELVKGSGIKAAEIEARIASAKEKLFSSRASRIRPITDDKSLLSWNALMNIAITKAGLALRKEQYIIRAEKHLEVLYQSFKTEDGLKHVWKNANAKINAHLDDYAYLVKSMLQLASATGSLGWLKEAFDLCELVIKEFSDEKELFFYYSSGDKSDLPVRKVDLYDSATPSANSIMAENLVTLGLCYGKTEWIARSEAMLKNMQDICLRYVNSFANWSCHIQRGVKQHRVVLCTGEEAMKYGRDLHGKYLPGHYILMSQKEIFEVPVLKEKYFSGESIIFVCTQQACLSPAHSVEETLQLFQSID
jgi:uncharacterized protein